MLQLVVRNLPVAVWTTDRSLRLTWAERGPETGDPGMPSTEDVGSPIDEVGAGEEGPLARSAHDRALAGEPVAYESGVADRWFTCRVEPLRDPSEGIVGVIGVALDITDRRLAREELQRSVAELRRTDRDRLRLLTYLVRAQEDERKRIADGIHDDSIQIMATAGLRLGMLARRVKSSEDRVQIEELQELVERSVGRLRRLLFELAPPELRRAGLAAAVTELLRKMAVDEERPLTFEVDSKLDGEPPEETQILLYRLAQEALTNVRKHAQASRIDVAIEEEDGGVLMEVRDDGLGFSPSEELSRPGHLGLAAMRDRAEMARGWWTIDSTPGGGTAVRFWLPVGGVPDGPRTR